MDFSPQGAGVRNLIQLLGRTLRLHPGSAAGQLFAIAPDASAEGLVRELDVLGMSHVFATVNSPLAD